MVRKDTKAMNWEPVIGLEVHIELKTKSKMFCRCSADYFGAEPNSHTCPICLGLPGALPKPNVESIKFVQKLGLALNCRIQLSSKFDRKNYFYPDLPKGFQISQYDKPFSINGHIEIKGQENLKRIRITRVHLEEDTGKLTHATINGRRVTLIDFNRSGVPLVEIVSEPEMSSSDEIKDYAQKLQQIVRYLGISDADMEKGSMRIEPNISLRRVGEKALPPYKIELKNINSFKFAQAAVEYEIERQAKILKSAKTPQQETRGWNEIKKQTVSQRSKELAHDYRYFPEPDLVPLSFKPQESIKLKSEMPELPHQKFKRLTLTYELSQYDAQILTRDIKVAEFFEEAVKIAKDHGLSPKEVANKIINKNINVKNTLPAQLIKILLESKKTEEIDDNKLTAIINSVLRENPKAVSDFTKGKETAIMFLAGQTLKRLKVKADPRLVIEKIKNILASSRKRKIES